MNDLWGTGVWMNINKYDVWFYSVQLEVCKSVCASGKTCTGGEGEG